VSEEARIILELVEQPWTDLDADERRRFVQFFRSLIESDDERAAYNAYIFMRHLRRMYKRTAASSSQTLAAQREVDSDRPTDPPPTGEEK
jgi:hypothetical protein